jgi:GGDEF domain-containing protein
MRTDMAKLKDPLIGLSIGLAVGKEGCNLSDVMRQADDQMYQDKAAHKKRMGDLANI